jgi:flavin reductase (DIM6/NTAB) family NADH-FMN oxidoreductase RutF
MAKIKIANTAFGYPMPMVVVGAEVEGKVNYMAVAWVSRVNANPPLIAVALGKSHHTNKGIHQHKEFSISVPSADIVKSVDHVGLVSGSRVDKETVFQAFYGELKHAPMVMECPIAMECRVAQVVDLPTNELFIGEIVGVYAEEQCLNNGRLIMEKMSPFLLTMPDNEYWSIGAQIGHAWKDGLEYGK